MKKFTTLMAVAAAAFAANAATATWNAADLTLANNDIVNGMTFTVNDNISFTIAKGESDKDALYRNTSDYPVFIQAYSKCTITFTANDADIKSIKFDVNTDQGKSPTPNWNIQDPAKTQYTETNPTWTGNVQEITFTVKSGAQITGLEIEYEGRSTIDPDPVDPDPVDPTPGEFQTAELFFQENQVAIGEGAQNVTLSDNGVTINFTSNSANATIDKSNGFFGTAEDYISLQYRYRAGGKSSNGVNSTNKGVITLPCDGTLTIYAFNNQATDRTGLIEQDDVNVFDHAFSASEAVTPEGSERKVYPAYNVELKKGTAYLLWPDNQLMIFGFKFEPKLNTTGVEEVVSVATIEDNAAYDLMGRRVSDSYKGIVIVNGKKHIRR